MGNRKKPLTHKEERRYWKLLADYQLGCTSELSDQERAELRDLHERLTGHRRPFRQFSTL